MGKKFEGSTEDRKDDRKNAKRLGMTLKEYEKSPQDAKADRKGQKRLDAKGKGK